MNDITALAQRMKAAAEKATPGEWCAFNDTFGTYSVHTPNDKRCGDIIKWTGFDEQDNADANSQHVAQSSPTNVLALVEALEARDKQVADYAARLNRLEKRCDHKGSVYWDVSGVKRCARCGAGIQVIEGEGQ